MWNYLFNTKICLHDKTHVKTKDYCETCANNLNQRKQQTGVDNIPVEYRALFLSIHNNINKTSDDICWTLKTCLPEKIKNYKLKNLIYALYKGDIGNKVLKNTCNNIECVNPYHLKSRFEPDQITKRVRVGFSRKYVDIADLTDDQWLRY